jgi:hypothetical protein
MALFFCLKEQAMSYSISAKGRTKIEARANIAREFRETVLSGQPVHRHDEEAAFANVDKHLALLRDPKEHEVVCVNMTGSIGGRDFNYETGDVGEITSSSGGCTVYIEASEV